MKSEANNRLQRAATSSRQSMAAEEQASGKSPALGSRRTCTALFVLQHNPKEVSKLMKKAMLVLLVVCGVAAMAMAQAGTISNTTDVLGAHLGYGRGCVMCHAPHSGPAGNGKTVSDSQAGKFALWGQDLTPLYGANLDVQRRRQGHLRCHTAGAGHDHQRP